MEIVVRVLAGLLAVTLFYMAWFVYEDEEKTIQSKLELWWINIDESKKSWLARQRALVALVSTKAVALLDRLFRSPLHSKESAKTALAVVAFEIGLLLLTFALWMPYEGLSLWAFSLVTMFSLALMVTSVGALFFDHREKWERTLIILLVLTLALYAGVSWIQAIQVYRTSENEVVLVNKIFDPIFCVAVLAVAVPLLQVSALLSRKVLMHASVASTELPTVIFATLFVAVPVLFFVALIWAEIEFSLGFLYPTGFLLIGGIVLVFALVAPVWIGIVAFALLLLFHRLAWPLLSRFVYIGHRHKVLQNKKLLNASGAVLSGIALASPSTWEVLGKLLDKAVS